MKTREITGLSGSEFCSARHPRSRAMTLIEMIVAVALSAIVLTVVALLFIFGLRSFEGLGNYTALSRQSRVAIDRMSRQMREATAIIAADTNLPVRSLTLTNANKGTTTFYSWDSTTQVLTCSETGQGTYTNLTGCNNWQFSFYQRTPTNNWNFYSTADLSLCKLINMTWKCSRTMLGKNLYTEDMMTAQIVLRKKR